MMNNICVLWWVTPSRVCELKYQNTHKNWTSFCHTLTGVWVEIIRISCSTVHGMSHPHGCVSWNGLAIFVRLRDTVTPSRVCELKSDIYVSDFDYDRVTPSRVCELKSHLLLLYKILLCHTLTGVLVEICRFCSCRYSTTSHPHGCVSWNSNILSNILIATKSHPHGCVSWNFNSLYSAFLSSVTPSRVCELK